MKRRDFILFTISFVGMSRISFSNQIKYDPLLYIDINNKLFLILLESDDLDEHVLYIEIQS